MPPAIEMTLATAKAVVVALACTQNSLERTSSTARAMVSAGEDRASAPAAQ